MRDYTIHQGDTYEKVAQKHGCSTEDIVNANPGVNANDLQIGQVIHLPKGHSSAPPRPSKPAPSSHLPGGSGGSNGGGSFVYYSGPASGFPDPSKWASYSALWSQNAPLMKFHDSDAEIDNIKEAIESVAKEANFDVRAILCIIMQECGGNVRVPTTDNGVRNPGIMQSHNGVEFNPRDPAGSILQMVKDGTMGTRSGPGLKELYEQHGNYYEAFRAYNSGSVDKAMGATADYVLNTANRLMGHHWNGM